jgi:hypothetical protein
MLEYPRTFKDTPCVFTHTHAGESNADKRLTNLI